MQVSEDAITQNERNRGRFIGAPLREADLHRLSADLQVDLPLLVEVQHHPDPLSSLVDLLHVILPGDFTQLSEHVLHLGRLPLSQTFLSERRSVNIS